eukprot:6464573-Amphidinium_carterae.2
MLTQVTRAVRKLVKYAVVTGTAVNKAAIDRATGELISKGAKVEWSDVKGPNLLRWSDCEKYMANHALALVAWFKANSHYKSWFDPVRARVVALLVAKCKNHHDDFGYDFATELEKLHEVVCDPTADTCLLSSNFLQRNLDKVFNDERTLAGHLAEAVMYGEINGSDSDPHLADIVLCGVGPAAGKLEPLVLDCLKRIERVMKAVPKILVNGLRRLNASSAGFLFEYPVAYAVQVAGVARVAAASESCRIDNAHVP